MRAKCTSTINKEFGLDLDWNQQMTIRVHGGRHLAGMNERESKETIVPHQCDVNENISRVLTRKIC